MVVGGGMDWWMDGKGGRERDRARVSVRRRGHDATMREMREIGRDWEENESYKAVINWWYVRESEKKHR